MKILVIGKTGQVGSHLASVLGRLGQVRLMGRDEADLAQAVALERAVRGEGADVVINAAAYTAVDKAESEAPLAHAINAEAPRALAEAARAMNAVFVHYSTDYVFNGQARTPYRETDATDPLGVYGRSKLAGEQGVAQTGGRYLIFRTAWVYSLHGHNFLKTMLRLAGERDELRIVDDQLGSPTFAGAIATGTAEVLARVREQGALEADQAGIYHMTCGGQTSWYGFTREIFRQAGIEHVRLTPIATADYPTPPQRPADSVLDKSRLQQVFGVALPQWEQGLRQCLAQGELER